MLFGERNVNLIYLDRSRFDFYGLGLSGILRLSFPEDTIKDQEVLDRQKVFQLIRSFINSNKLRPGNIVIILSDTLVFEKNLPKIDAFRLETQIRQFMENIPFEDIESRVFHDSKGIKIIAAGKDLYEIIIAAFQLQGFHTDLVIPVTFFDKNIQQNIANGADVTTISTIFTKIDSLRDKNMMKNCEAHSPAPKDEKGSAHPDKQNKNRLILLLPLLLILLGILAFMIMKNNQSLPAKNAASPNQSSTNSPSPAPSAAKVSPSVPPETEKPVSEVTIQIVNNSGQPALEDDIRKNLGQAGFVSIGKATAANINSSRPIIIFSKSLSASVRNTVLALLQKSITSPLVQEGDSTQADIIIILVKPV